jgi:hypothetical protein
MKSATGAEPRIWGAGMIGFGSYHYRYEALLKRLGKFTTGKSCLYVKRLADVDEAVLRDLIASSVQHMQQTYSAG